jgi:adenylate cyclase
VPNDQKRKRFSIWPMPMSVVLAGSFGLLVAVTVSVVLLITVNANFRNTFSLLNDKSVLMIEILRDAIRSHLDPAQEMVTGLAEMYSNGKLELSDSGQLHTVLRTALVSNPGVEAVIIYRNGREKYGYFRGPDGVIEQIPTSVEENPAILAYLDTVGPRAGTRWGPLVYVQQDVYANVGAPLVRAGKIIGFITAAVGTRLLSRIAKEVADENDNTTFVLHGAGHVMAHSNSELIKLRQMLSPSQPVVPIAELGDNILRARAQWRPLDRAFMGAARRGVNLFEVQYGDNGFIVMTGQLSGYGAVPWHVGAYFKAHEVGQEVGRLLFSIAAGMLAAILSIVLAVWLGRKVARPLGEISKQAQRLAALDFDGVDELPGSRIREIDTEARAFNAMLAGLRAFTAYVPKSLVTKLIDRGVEEAGRSRAADLTVLFTDIVGFTSLSETLPAQETAALLNHHFEGVVSCINQSGGTVDKFMGDGLMAFWGAPDDMPDHATAATNAAVAIAARVRADIAQALEQGRPPVRVRIGVHTGPVIVGNIGALDRVNYTIVGDTVNVCQRLQHLGKEIAPDADVVVLLSGTTRQQLNCDIAMISAGRFPVRGRNADVEVWQVVEGTTDAPVEPRGTVSGQ